MDLVLQLARTLRDVVLPELGSHAGRAQQAQGAGGDVTFAVDAVAEEELQRFIDEHAPDTAFYSEDRGLVASDNATHVLIVDPIDGTRPAMAGLESACVAVALAPLANDGDPRMADIESAAVVEIKSGDWFLAVKGHGVRSSRKSGLSTNTDITRMFWGYGFRGRPARATVEVLGPLIDASSVGGGTFELGSQAFAMTRVITGQLDAVIEVGSRVIDEIPGIRKEFEALGHGEVLNNSPYDLAAPWLCLTEAGGVVTDGWGNPLDGRRLLGSGHEFQMSSISAANRTLHKQLVEAIDQGIERLRRLRDKPAGYRAQPPPPPRPMLQPVAVAHKHLSDYASIVRRTLVDEIKQRAERLEGKRILHVSATAFGGGVSEILYTLVPLMVDVGLQCEWHVIYGREEFFNATKVMHNALQGSPQDLEEAQWETWRRYNEINAQQLSDGWDVCIVHDPQPAALATLVPDKARHWIWRCHIDLSTPNPGTLEKLQPYLQPYEAGVFHMPEYVPAGLDGRARIYPPAIDPLAPKNMAFSPEDAVYICGQFGIDVDRPLLCQVSRFDPWKDPLGVIDAYRIVKREIPDVQLALVGSMATDDPEGWDFFNATVAHADGDPDIHILNNLNNVGAIEVNAFQSHCDVVIQKSTREGFGLTVTEAIWKARPFVGGNVGGIPAQVTDGESGFLVETVDQCAQRCLEILQDPGLGKQLGRAGKEAVRQRFLMPRLLRDWLELFEQLEA
jgi:trehalose synthase